MWCFYTQTELNEALIGDGAKLVYLIVFLTLTSDRYSAEFITYLSIKDIWYYQDEYVLTQLTLEFFSYFITIF